jgi:hypothetical protein
MTWKPRWCSPRSAVDGEEGAQHCGASAWGYHHQGGGGASVLFRPRRLAVQHQGALAVLLDLTVELGRLCFNSTSAAARQRRWLDAFGGQNVRKGGRLYSGKHPIVIGRDSELILSRIRAPSQRFLLGFEMGINLRKSRLKYLRPG